MDQVPDTHRLLGWREVESLTRLSLRHITRLESSGAFPKRLRVGARGVRWARAEILEWVEARKAEREAA